MSDWRDQVPDGAYVSFKETGSFFGTFINAEWTDGKFGRCLQLNFKDTNGKDKKLTTKSIRLINLMKTVPDGTKIKIIRTGEGYDTFYEVEVIKDDIGYLKDIEKKYAKPIDSIEKAGWDD